MTLELFEKYEWEKVPAGTIIFQENEPGDAMYMIMSGRVAIFKRVMEKVDKTLGILEAGEYFGEMSLLLKADRTATAKAIEDTEIVKLTRETFRELLQEHFEWGVNLLIQLAHRLEKANEDAILSALELELSKRKPHPYFSTALPAEQVLIAAGSFQAEDLPKVLRLRKQFQWDRNTHVVVSLFKPGQIHDALIYIIQTDDIREVMKLTLHFKALVRWNISLAVSADDELMDTLFKKEGSS